MKYFKEIKTGEVYAYSVKDLEQAAILTETSPQVFLDISERLKGMTELTGEVLDLYLKPQPTTEQLAEQGRAERDAVLLVLDTLVSNPLRYGELSAEQKEEAGVYRQELLDVPQQISFPKTYTMPEIPIWLS